jgi:hypothetical protein
MITLERLRGKDLRTGEISDAGQCVVLLDGKRLGFIADDNPTVLMIHRYIAPGKLADIAHAVRDLIQDESLSIQTLPPPPKTARATTHDL